MTKLYFKTIVTSVIAFVQLTSSDIGDNSQQNQFIPQ